MDTQNNSPQNNDLQTRYSRQTLFAPIGTQGQQKLAAAKVLLVGCGALGCHIAETLIRAGIGSLTLIDRDFVELSNLPRQALFDEQDVAEGLPKAPAAARRLRAINSRAVITPHVADVNHESIEYFLDPKPDLILDGTDNLLTRLLINDVAIKHAIPWIYGACIADQVMGMTILPTGKPCLRCILDQPPEPGQVATCDTAGIIAPAVMSAAAFESAEALKILTGDLDRVSRRLIHFSLWTNQYKTSELKNFESGCPCCAEKQFDFLAGKGQLSTVSLCGRNTVQIRPRKKTSLDLAALAEKLKPAYEIFINEFLLRLKKDNLEITLFPDARAIIKGTQNIDEARSLYARFVGH